MSQLHKFLQCSYILMLWYHVLKIMSHLDQFLHFSNDTYDDTCEIVMLESNAYHYFQTNESIYSPKSQ